MSERLEKAKEYRAEREKLRLENQAVMDDVKAKNRDLTPEERTGFDARFKQSNELKAKAEEIEADYDRITRQEEADREARASAGVSAAARPDRSTTDKAPEVAKREAAKRWDTAFRVWGAGKGSELSPEERQSLGLTDVRKADVPEGTDPRLLGGGQGVRFRLRSLPINPDQRRVWNRDSMRWEHRANEPQSHVVGFGGYTMPDAPMAALEDALLQYGGMRQARTTVLRTANGNDLPIPSANDTANKGSILAENNQKTGATPIAFTQVVLQGFKYTSDFVLASIEFLQDTSIDAPSYIAQKLGERIGRITNDHFTKGSNSSQPYGAAWAATLGKTAAGVSAFTFADLSAFTHSVDPAYRTNAELMFNDTTLGVLEQVVDGDNRLIWAPGLQFRAPDRILGYPYVINQSMDSIAAGKHSMLFGDFSKYYIRDVMDVMVVRLDERFMDYGQVGFIAFSRHDSDLVDAGTHPIKYLRHPAS